MTDNTSLGSASHKQLYKLARQRGIDGRSSMTKAELIAALRGSDDGVPPPAPPAAEQSEIADVEEVVASRFDAFSRIAQARASGEMVMLPRSLRGNDRRVHVRQTLREDHRTRIAQRSQDAKAKFDKLADSLYSFFRGTSLLFYRDLAGEDAWMPTVLTLGDVHPENFGVMPSADNVPIFGVNDFDEAYYAPFTWDLKRGAVGFMIAAQEGGYGRKHQRVIARRFVRGYIDGITTFATDETEQDEQLRIDNAPKLIRKLIENALEHRSTWLASDYHDEFGRGFRSDDELVPITSRRDEFQELIQRFVEENDVQVPPRAGDMRVKDVAVRRGQGTASLGLERYYVLIEGERADASDDLIIEFKQARRSALAGLVPPSDFGFGGEGERIAHAHGVQLVRGDLFYGGIEFEGLSFMTRERAPYRDSIDVDDLSKKQWRRYAEICGRALAHAHALSDEIGELDHDIEPKIVEAIGPHELFIDDIQRFADEAAQRVRRDHRHFVADHALGAFDSIDTVYR